MTDEKKRIRKRRYKRFLNAFGLLHGTTELGELPEDLEGTLKGRALRIAVGSCNKANRDQDHWGRILEHAPDVWLWTGDMIYADTEDMEEMAECYQELKENPEYQAFEAAVEVIGVWDDHDFGYNNADSRYPHRAESQRLTLDFLGEPADSPRRRQEGIWTTHDHDLGEVTLKIVLLDGRYHRVEEWDGPMLGEAQWEWLEGVLEESTADIHLLASGTQFLRDNPKKATWGEYPRERARLFELLARTRTPGVMFLSGDIHVGEISRRADTVVGYPLVELTASGLTHRRLLFGLDNAYRTSLLVKENFGLLDIVHEDGETTLHLRLIDMKGRLRAYESVPLSALQPPGGRG